MLGQGCVGDFQSATRAQLGHFLAIPHEKTNLAEIGVSAQNVLRGVQRIPQVVLDTTIPPQGVMRQGSQVAHRILLLRLKVTETPTTLGQY